uniref:Serpin domain-containing protein n=1 Tax=Panagrolaimus davidi TaxID=227884 RepID=A0A914QUD4_9BILA
MAKKFVSITEAQLGFALKLLQSQHNDNSSIVFSPVSIALAMAMINVGAQGNTAKQINDALAEGFLESEIHAYFKTLIEHIRNEYAVKEQPPEPEIDPNDKVALERQAMRRMCLQEWNPYISGFVLETFNRAYINDDINLRENFVEKFDEFYQGGIEKVNFEDAVTVAKAKMMKQNSKEWQYSDTKTFQFLTLNYQQCDLSMRIILPRELFGLANLIKNLTANELMQHLTKEESVEVIVKMPRFEIKTEFDAVKALKNMGIKDLFETNANLEGISSDSKSLWISSVLHNAYIYTDEEGTEAAAVTVQNLKGYNLYTHPPPIDFTANHPFIYLITDSKNNIYFFGVVSGAEFDDYCDSGSSYQSIKDKMSQNPVTNFAKKLFGKKKS